MTETTVALTLDSTLLERVDQLVVRALFRSRSQAIETALAEMLARLARTRLAEECAKSTRPRSVASPTRRCMPTPQRLNTES